MYKPAPPRPKKTNITRTRTGCLDCRRRRVKCDERKPVCGRCERLGGECKQDTGLKFCQVYKHGLTGKPTGNYEEMGRGVDFNHPTAYRSLENGLHFSPDATLRNRVAKVPKAGQTESGPLTPTIPQSLIPQANPTDAVRFYFTAWDWQSILPLASMLHIGDASPLSTSPLFVDMMTAVSASHLSRTSPQRRLLPPSSTHEQQQQSFRPHPAHESISQEFYGSVMKKMARWSEQDLCAQPILGLAVLTLFCLVESSMGSFQTFGLHYDGATKLIENYATSALAQDAQAGAVLGPLVEVRMQMWWRRVYFGTPEFHRNRPKVSLDPALRNLAGLESRRTSILLILCESHRINNAAIIAHWDRYSDNLVGAKSAENAHPRIEPFEDIIKGERERLNTWCQIYPFSGGMEDVQAASSATSAPLEVRALHMASHTEAMNFAYYIASRVLQSQGPLNSLTLRRPGEIGGAYGEVESWIQLLLRVVAGMDWKDCVRYNMYTIGITGVLLACLLHSHDLRVGLWCEAWLRDCLDGSSFEEGSFPAFQTLSIIRLINKERSQGRDVFGLFQTVEDGGGSGKFGSYQSQALSSLLLYSRCRTTGRLLSHYISI